MLMLMLTQTKPYTVSVWTRLTGKVPNWRLLGYCRQSNPYALFKLAYAKDQGCCFPYCCAHPKLDALQLKLLSASQIHLSLADHSFKSKGSGTLNYFLYLGSRSQCDTLSIWSLWGGSVMKKIFFLFYFSSSLAESRLGFCALFCEM